MKLHDQSVLLGEVLERQGSPAVRTALLSGRRELLRALHRCRNCAAHERCEAWLRSGARGNGFGAFCPNASYVAHIMRIAC